MEEYLSKVFTNLQEAVNEVYELSSNYAIQGVKEGIGGPFGAGILIKTNDEKYKILTIARNTVIESKDPTCHAEVNAIRQACKILNSKSLENCILVTTAKSCPMCLSASCWANIKTIYFSQDYENASESGFRDDAIAEYIRGNNKIVNEKRLINPNCEKPFIVWNQKLDKEQY